MLRLTRPYGKYWYIGGVVQEGKKKATVKRYSTGILDKSEAQSYLERETVRIKDELRFGKKSSALDNVTLFDACDQWVKLKDPQGAQVSIASAILARLGSDFLLENFTTAKWQNYRAQHMQRRAPATVQMHKAVLRGFFFAVGATPPEMPVPKKRPAKEVKLTIEEANRLMNEYPLIIRGPATFARYGGLRANEVARLKLSHINWNTQELELPASLNKNGRARTVPMHPQMIAVAQTALDNKSGNVFEKTEGVPFPYEEYNKNNPFQNFHNSARKRAGLEYFRWHDWRHHWAFMCVEGGMDIRTLQKIGGWSSLEMVAKYLAPNYEKAREVLKVMK